MAARIAANRKAIVAVHMPLALASTVNWRSESVLEADWKIGILAPAGWKPMPNLHAMKIRRPNAAPNTGLHCTAWDIQISLVSSNLIKRVRQISYHPKPLLPIDFRTNI